jgi:outer membrane protein OmpA-like peptidoglycan-associated protein
LWLALLLGSVSPVHAAEESTGPSLPEHLQQIESLQRRADMLAFGKTGANNYHLAKARTWLDMALSEYYEGEGVGIVTSSIAQAGVLLDALEKDQTDIPMDTPMQAPGSEAVRPDLWKKIALLKSYAKFSCGQRAIAEAEIYLVWAGHEKLESSWSNAKSYARSAENLLNEAKNSINGCVANISANEKITLFSDMLFGFNEAAIKPSKLWRLNRLIDSIRMVKTLEGIVLVGHTDRLRSDGHPERNQLLSEKRAETIKQYLIAKGIPGDSIHASGAGSSQPVVQCSSKMNKAKQIVCLQPNRRVEIIMREAK